MEAKNSHQKAYLVGGGIASLAAAAYLIRDGEMKGDNITIIDDSDLMGGSLDGAENDNGGGYKMRGFRMLEEKIYTCVFDLMSFIPSLTDSQKTLKEEFLSFNRTVHISSQSRIVENGSIVDARPMTLSKKDRNAGLKLLFRSEESLGTMTIEDYFTPDFFQSHFWIEVCTIFSFLPWHSLAEFRRYLIRFLQEAPTLDTVSGMRSTPFNQYEGLALPVAQWLQQHGVRLQNKSTVTNVEFETNGDKKTATKIFVTQDGEEKVIPLDKEDLLFMTLGSMVANSTYGSTDKAPVLNDSDSSPAWDLWDRIAQGNPEFGKPSVFHRNIDKTKWISFTCTFRDPQFFTLMEEFSGRKAGEEGPITFSGSPWYFYLDLPAQPHYKDQPKDVFVCQGYALYPEKEGEYVQKKMSDCTGAEIFTELCGHLGFREQLPSMLRTMDCTPCMMPYITSQFMPRAKGDRPQVVPKSAVNFAFLGQYTEIPNDIVFTIEYAVRSAQIAVKSLLKLKKKVTPMYKAKRHPRVLLSGMLAVFR